MTTIDVKRFRRQEGHIEIYRGSEYSVDFIPKVLMLVIVANAVVERRIANSHGGRRGESNLASAIQ
jgi:nitrogen regulatory protein PII